MSTERMIADALSVIDGAAAELMQGAYAQQRRQEPLSRVPILDEAAVERRASLGADLKAQAAKINRKILPEELAVSLAVAEFTADRWSKEARWFWHVHDPLGVGFYGMFGPTAYCGGFYLSTLSGVLARETFERPGDLNRYLGLIADVVDLITSMETRLRGQYARQIRMPGPQQAQARALLKGLAAQSTAMFAVAPARLAGLERTDRFAKELAALLAGPLSEAFRSLEAFVAESEGQASDTVGLGQYPGGGEIYEDLVKLYTTQDLSPAEVHAKGLARMSEVRQAMWRIREEAKFAGEDADYLAAMALNPRWRAADAASVEAVFQTYIDRLKPHMAANFNLSTGCPHGVAPLPEALASSMTFGYFDGPKTPGDTGRYLFNAGNLTQVALPHIASLNYHELVPGHHFHLSTQMENTLLPPVRKYNFFNAFNEGWAEYAATLAGEIGMYPEPEERFGRLMMDAFLTCRLVVDTGMNIMGWSLETARAYMRENSFMSENEIRTETIRYSCDIPGQSLAYKLGDTFLFEQRERLRAARGAAFDIREFHDAVLRPGALPLPLVAETIDRRIAAGVAP